MNTQGITVAALLLVVALGGCGSTTKAEAPSAPASTTPTEAPTPTPTVSVATENEVASIIAGSQKTWREAEEKGFDCRLAHVEKDDSPLAEVELLTCYTNEITAGLEAKIAIRDLKALNIPPSMQPLVEETTAALQGMADVDLEGACGEAMTVPNDSKKCSTALGSRYSSYHSVSSVLAKWAPYL